jgi:hypothetical protein
VERRTVKGLAALLLTSCAAGPVPAVIELPRSSAAALLVPALLAIDEPTAKPDERAELRARCDAIERDAPICDDESYDPECEEAVRLLARVVVRCRELAAER